jgi:hypothetical protein
LREVFHPVIDSHVRNHPTATSGGNPHNEAVQVRKDQDCSTLPGEIAHNLPEVGPSVDVRSLTNEWAFAQIWCAFYWYTDRIRQYELGRFGEIAEKGKPVGEWTFGVGWSSR